MYVFLNQWYATNGKIRNQTVIQEQRSIFFLNKMVLSACLMLRIILLFLLLLLSVLRKGGHEVLVKARGRLLLLLVPRGGAECPLGGAGGPLGGARRPFAKLAPLLLLFHVSAAHAVEEVFLQLAGIRVPATHKYGWSELKIIGTIMEEFGTVYRMFS
jgi:hypothetical protein